MISSSMQSGRVDILIDSTLPSSVNFFAAESKYIISFLSIAVKLPPKYAICAVLPASTVASAFSISARTFVKSGTL